MLIPPSHFFKIFIKPNRKINPAHTTKPTKIKICLKGMLLIFLPSPIIIARY